MHWSCQAGPGHFGTGRPVRAMTAPEDVSIPLHALEVTLEVELLKEKPVVKIRQTIAAYKKNTCIHSVFIYRYKKYNIHKYIFIYMFKIPASQMCF